MVGFDSTMLSVLLNPHCKIPTDPTTNAPVSLPKVRAEFLVSKIQKERGRILIPTPVVSEILTAIGPEAQEYFDIINRNRLFEVSSFDEKAAIELAFLNREVFASNDPKNGQEPYQKMKIDRQILAILKSRGATEIYTDDTGLKFRALLCKITPIGIVDLSLPPDEKQMKFKFEAHEALPEAEGDPAGTGSH